MGYWHIGNTNPIYPAPTTSVTTRDTSICTDVCTISSCGYDSTVAPRVDHISRVPRTPLVDFGISEWPYNSADYGYYPDLQMFPAFAGAVVPAYNIPELINAKSSIVFSRATLAAIFLGKIRYWNDIRILNDNSNSSIYNLLQSIQQPITVVVRHDSSGISMIFAQALSSFDPITTGSIQDFSFANTAGKTSSLAKPLWCDPLTDEVFIFTVSQCTSSLSVNQKLVSMTVIDPAWDVRIISWSCDTSPSSLQNAFLQQLGMQVTVNLQVSPDKTSRSYYVALSDSRLVAQNWHKPVVTSSLSTKVTVTVTTLQEGGFWNSHFNISKYFITPTVQSLFVLNASYAAVLFNLTYVGVNGAATTAQLDSSVVDLTPTLQSFLNAIVPQGVTVSKQIFPAASVASSGRRFTQYQITFTEQRSVPALGVNAIYKSNSVVNGVAVAAGGRASGAMFTTIFLDYNNFPRFPDPHYSGVASGGRFTCYKRSLNYVPFSYLTAQLTDLNAQVPDCRRCALLVT